MKLTEDAFYKEKDKLDADIEDQIELINEGRGGSVLHLQKLIQARKALIELWQNQNNER